MADITITFTAAQRELLPLAVNYALAYAKKYDDPSLNGRLEELLLTIGKSKCGDPSCNHCGEVGERRCDWEDE